MTALIYILAIAGSIGGLYAFAVLLVAYEDQRTHFYERDK
jgi:hypothetical protein